jgi:glycosyltransferase involved in cell wall biosynthesis
VEHEAGFLEGVGMTKTSPGLASPRAAVASEPLVSVCISAYNVERFVGEALGSVLAQTYRNIEVILVDNGSVDRTFEAVKAVADERVHSFRVPKNLGGYQAMNLVAGMAKGEFMAVYHSDDHYEPEIVAREVAYLQAHPEVGAVFTLFHLMDQDGHIYHGEHLPPEFAGKESLGYEDVFRYILRNKNTKFCCPTFMVRREVFEAVGPFAPEKWEIATDLEMWLRIVRRFPIAILNERLIRYRVTQGQWSARYNHLRTTPDWAHVVMEHYLEKDGWLAKLSASDLAEYAFHRCDDHTFCAANLVILGDVAAARKLLRERNYPWAALRNGNRRRKVRLLVLRALLFGGLRLGLQRPLAAMLKRIGR